MKHRNKQIIKGILFFLVLLIIWLYGIRFMRTTLLGSKYRDHMLLCFQLPPKEKVEEVWQNHKKDFYKTIGIEKKDKIEVFPRRVTLPSIGDPDITNLKCKKTADLVFIVENTKQKEQLEKAFPTSFYGIPYRIKSY